MTSNKLTDRGIRALAAAHFPQLRALRIENNALTNEGAKALLKSEHLDQLLWLTLDEVSEPLREQLLRHFPGLRVFCSGYGFLSGPELEAARAKLTGKE